MDYGNLAQYSNPGTALPGMEGSVVNRWHDMNNLQQMALQRSIPLAQQSAEQSALQHQSFVEGQPGRMDAARLSNMKAADAVQSFPAEQASKALERALGDANKRAELQDFTKDIGTDGDAYINAQDESEKQTILSATKGKQVRMPGGKTYTMGSDPKMDDFFLTAAGKSRANAPALQNKLKLAEMNNEAKISIAAAREAGLDERLAKTLSAKETVARIKASEAAKPMNEGQGLVARLDAEFGGDSRAWLQAYTVAKTYAATIKPEQAAGTANSVLGGGGLKVPGVAPVEFPPSAPGKPVPTPAAPAQTPKFEAGKIYQDAKGNKAKWNGTGWEPVR